MDALILPDPSHGVFNLASACDTLTVNEAANNHLRCTRLFRPFGSGKSLIGFNAYFGKSVMILIIQCWQNPPNEELEMIEMSYYMVMLQSLDPVKFLKLNYEEFG